MRKILLIAIVMPLVLGCANVAEQIIKTDTANYEANKKVAVNLLEHWSFNSGFIAGLGVTSKVAFPIKDASEAKALVSNPAISLGIAEMDKIAEDAGKWKKEDYYAGYALGLSVRLGSQSAIDLAKLLIPAETLTRYVPWIMGL